MADEKEIDFNIEDAAIDLVKNEVVQWESAIVFVTDRVAFKMRDLIRNCRNNYWGIFKSSKDKHTNREKTWIPLTESMVDAVVKNIDLDQKDIKVFARMPGSKAVARLLRPIVKRWNDKVYMGEKQDSLSRQLAIDGTRVWKFMEDEDGAPLPPKAVDLLNIYIDPQAESIQEALRFTERALLGVEQVKKMDGWINTDEVVATTNFSVRDRDSAGTSSVKTGATAIKLVDVYEMWGMMPKAFITGMKEDKDEEIHGHIVISGLDGSNPKVHLIEENTKKDQDDNIIKPYEEAWYQKVDGRWYGKGIAEKLIMLQTYINTIVNIRINRAYLTQMGIFKVRKGSSVTPQMLRKLPGNGAIQVDSMDDVEQFVMQEASQASYTDEQNIVAWSERVTSAFEVVTGEALPASTSATAVAVQGQSAQSQFVTVKEGMGKFYERCYDRHIIPALGQTIKDGDLIRFVKDDELYKEMAERVIAFKLEEELQRVRKETGRYPTVEVIERAVDKAREQLEKDEEIFFEVIGKLITDGVDTKVRITNEELDVGVTVNNLIQMAQLDPESRSVIVEDIYELLGLEKPKIERQPVLPEQVGQEQPVAPNQNLQQLLTAANTLGGDQAPSV